MSEILKTENLVFEYRQVDEAEKDENKIITAANDSFALDGVSITIQSGEFVAILGHNGSGKSTLARHINALLLPTSGTVLFLGMDTKIEDNVWKIRNSCGMAFQNPDNQIIATIVQEDVAFGPENLGVPSDEIRRRVDFALKSVDMEEYANHSPHFLSGGQKQRVAIAGILAMKPLCIVLDEPTAMLDPMGRKEVLDTVVKLQKEEGITVVHITHYMDEAVKADRIFVMEEGKVVMEGTPTAIFSEFERMNALRLDVPDVTEIAFKLRKRGIELPEGILTIDGMVDAICQYRSKM